MAWSAFKVLMGRASTLLLQKELSRVEFLEWPLVFSAGPTNRKSICSHLLFVNGCILTSLPIQFATRVCLSSAVATPQPSTCSICTPQVIGLLSLTGSRNLLA